MEQKQIYLNLLNVTDASTKDSWKISICCGLLCVFTTFDVVREKVHKFFSVYAKRKTRKTFFFAITEKKIIKLIFMALASERNIKITENKLRSPWDLKESLEEHFL